MSPPTAPALLERACRLANEALHTVALQRRRLRSSEPEDHTFVMRRWADFQFLIIALRRLRRAVAIATHTTVEKEVMALDAFDAAIPGLKTMRKRRRARRRLRARQPAPPDKSIDRRQLEVGCFDDQTLQWLRMLDGSDHELDADAALAAAERVYASLRQATRSHLGLLREDA